MVRPRTPQKAPRRHNGFGAKADLAVALFETGQKLYSTGNELWKKHLAFTVVVLDTDAVYSEVLIWLTKTLPTEKQRSLLVSSNNSADRGNDAPVSDSDSGSVPKSKPLIIKFNERAKRRVKIDGFSVSVQMLVPDVSANMVREPEPARILFTARTQEAQKAVIALLETLNENRVTERKAVLRMVNQWGGWNTRSDLPPRTMESVSLPAEQKDRILEDLRTFLDQEEKYNSLAIPWHRGYMFHGPPGTGKTSLVKALANACNMDLWYVSLADLKAESGLLQLLSNVGPRSILLLEDIDTMKITHDRDGSDQGTISMSSLLNTLDGVATPHGLITVMTTNRFDILDEALTRAGRMDLVEKLDYPSMATIMSMFNHFYGQVPDEWTEQRWDDIHGYHEPIEGLSTAQVAEVMKRHMENFGGAVEGIAEILRVRQEDKE